MLFPGEKIRLLHDLPEAGLAQGEVCAVVATSDGQEGKPAGVKIKWYASGQERSATVPRQSLEPVLSACTEERTAALWGLETPPERLVETVMHAMLDRGLALSNGLNVVRLRYDASERWWKRDELLADPSGATVAASAHLWDGCVVGFDGDQRFHLEFRLKGRGEAVLLLHERDALYMQQVRRIPAAMEMARVLMELSTAGAAQFCVFPAGGPWLLDEDWGSMLRPPYYPDFYLLPEAQALPELPVEFRTARLAQGRVMVTSLPVKFAPHDSPLQPGDRELALASLRKCKALGEKYYDQLYETRLGATGLYSSAKDAFYDAISLANQLGMKEDATALGKRLQHIKDVFRSQFT